MLTETEANLVADGFVTEPDLSMMKNVYFGVYCGIPSIYAVIVDNGVNKTATYVTQATYACNPDGTNSSDKCGDISILAKVLLSGSLLY